MNRRRLQLALLHPHSARAPLLTVIPRSRCVVWILFCEESGAIAPTGFPPTRE